MAKYRIEQNFGGKKIWRNCDFETLVEKTLVNPRLACIFVLHRECWRKKLGELWRFAKFAKVFSPPKFCSIRYIIYVSESAKTGLICTKYTYSFYHIYLFFVWVIQYMEVLLNSLGHFVYNIMVKFLIKYC